MQYQQYHAKIIRKVTHIPGFGEMGAAEFIEIQEELGLSLYQAADFLRVHYRTINNWREGSAISGPVALAMRMLRKHKDELNHWMLTQEDVA